MVDTVNVIVPDGCAITTQAGFGQTYNIEMQNGQYKNDIGKTRLSVFCNTDESFSIYAIGYSNNEYGNTDMLASTTTNNNNTNTNTNTNVTNIPTGTATSGDTSNWAMKIEAVDGSTIGNGNSNTNSATYTPTIISPFNNFTNVPSTYTKIAEVASVSSNVNEAAIDATYAVYMSLNQPSGSYTGKVKYTVVHPASAIPNQPVATTAGKIGYVPNANGMVLDTMADQEYTGYTSTVSDFTTPITPGNEATLWASNFKRTGYGFAGWNTAYDYSGTTYGPNETITVPDNINTEGLTLYAVWIKSRGNLQNWDGCSSLAQGQVTALTDTRDNNTYAIAKLADGNCWMIENLRLGGNTQMTLTLADTDITSNFILSASQDPTQTAWCADDNAACYDQSILYSGNVTDSVSNMIKHDTNVYSYGNYYNWYTATAGSGTYSTADDTSVASSVCPKGWRLPGGGSGANSVNNDFGQLAALTIGYNTNYVAFGIESYRDDDGSNKGTDASKAVRAYPNNFLYSGHTYDSLVDRSHGTFWSAKVGSWFYAYGFGFRSYYLNPGTNHNSRTFGFAIRCLAR